MTQEIYRIKEFIGLMVPEGYESIREGEARQEAVEQKTEISHLEAGAGSREGEPTEGSQGCELSKPSITDVSSSACPHLLKVPRSSPNSTNQQVFKCLAHMEDQLHYNW